MLKKLFSILLSVAMMSAMIVPAFAMEQDEATDETQNVDTSGIEISNHYSYENDDEIGVSYDISIDVDKYSSPEALGEALEEALSNDPLESVQDKEEISAADEPEPEAEEPETKTTRPDNMNTKNPVKTLSGSIEELTNNDATDKHKDTIFTKWPVRLFLTIF